MSDTIEVDGLELPVEESLAALNKLLDENGDTPATRDPVFVEDANIAFYGDCCPDGDGYLLAEGQRVDMFRGNSSGNLSDLRDRLEEANQPDFVEYLKNETELYESVNDFDTSTTADVTVVHQSFDACEVNSLAEDDNVEFGDVWHGGNVKINLYDARDE